MRMRSSHDGDLSKRNMNSNAIVASLRKQRMFHFIDWQAFVLTIEWIGGLATLTCLPSRNLSGCRVGTGRVQQPPPRKPTRHAFLYRSRVVSGCRSGEIVGDFGISAGTAVQDVAVAEQALKYSYEKTGYAP